jgi:hypothetical protein
MVFLLGIVGRIRHFPVHGTVRREMSALFVLDSTLSLSHSTFRIAALTALWFCLSVSPDSYLDGILYWGVVDDDKVATASGTCDFVAFDAVLVFVYRLLHVRRYHVGEHGNLCLESCSACLAPSGDILGKQRIPTVVGCLGKRLGTCTVNVRVGKHVVAVVAWRKWNKPQVFLYEIEHVAVLYGLDALGPIVAIVIEAVEAWHYNAYGIL